MICQILLKYDQICFENSVVQRIMQTTVTIMCYYEDLENGAYYTPWPDASQVLDGLRGQFFVWW